MAGFLTVRFEPAEVKSCVSDEAGNPLPQDEVFNRAAALALQKMEQQGMLWCQTMGAQFRMAGAQDTESLLRFSNQEDAADLVLAAIADVRRTSMRQH
jgi:hypothetical protein